MGRAGDLSGQDRSDASESSCTESRYDPGNQDEIARLRRALKGATDQGEDRSQEQSIDATQAVRDLTASKAADDGTQVVLCDCRLVNAAPHAAMIASTHNGDDAALMGHVNDVALGIGPKTDGLKVTAGRVDAAHDTLVIALEEDCYQGKCLDSNVQLGRRKPFPESGVAHDRIADHAVFSETRRSIARCMRK